MDKKGGLLKIIVTVIIVLLLILAALAFYFYNFYVFKTVRVCIGDSVDTKIPCNTSQNCIDVLIRNKIESDLNSAPEFVQEKFKKVINDVIYCDMTCQVKNVSGINYKTGKLEIIDKCKMGEKEIKMDIRGKEGMEILKWMQEQNLKLYNYYFILDWQLVT